MSLLKKKLFSTDFHKQAGTALLNADISTYIKHIIISIVLGIVAGAGAILFHNMLETMRHFFMPDNFTKMFNISHYFIVLIPVVGATICVLMTRFFMDIAKEKGVLSVIKSIILNKGLIPFKVTVFHLIASLVSIGSGIPLGPEGPAAKIGSGIGSLMSQGFKLKRDDMRMYTAAGAGAAIAAVFNAPIAGVFFGIEVILLNDLKNRALSALIISSVVANVLSHAFLGDKPVFTIPRYSLGGIEEYPFYLLFGLIAGLLCLFYFELKKFFGYLIKKLPIKHTYILLIPASIIFGLVLLKYYNLFGIGYSTINSVLSKEISSIDVFLLLLLKIVFLALFLKAGAYGGTFAPALSIGAFLGFIFAIIVNAILHTTLDPATFALVGMGGVLAGINSVPLTAIMLVFEVTNDHNFILPLMFVSILSYLVTVYYHRGSVYSSELLSYGIDISKKGEVDLLGKIKVQQLIRRNHKSANYKTPFKDLLKIILGSEYTDIMVVDDNNSYLGIVSLKDVRQAIVDNDIVDLLIAADLSVHYNPIFEDDPVSIALLEIEKFDVDNIPVINKNKPNEVVGILTHQDIIQAYNKLLKEWETNQFLVNYKNDPG